MLGQRMNSCFILIYQSSLSGTLLPTFPYLFPAPHKALHFWKVNFSKQESVGGQRWHYLGPWEVWVWLMGLQFTFLPGFHLYIMEDFQQGTNADSILPVEGDLEASASIPDLTGETSHCGSRGWVWPGSESCRDWMLLKASTELCLGFHKRKVLAQQNSPG